MALMPFAQRLDGGKNSFGLRKPVDHETYGLHELTSLSGDIAGD